MTQAKKPTIEQRIAEARAEGFREGYIEGQAKKNEATVLKHGIINYQED